MNGTTLKLSPKLKQRIAPLAKLAKKTPHAWMVDALEGVVERSELNEEFIQEALEASRDIANGAPTYASEDVHAWFLARAAGRKVKLPPPKRRRSA